MKKIIAIIIALTVFLSAYIGKDKVRLAEKSVIISAISFCRIGDEITMTVETVLPEETNTGKLMTFTSASIDGTVKTADKILPYSLIYSHCSAIILNENISKSDFENITELTKSKQLPLSSVIMLTDGNETPLKDRKTGLTGYELTHYFEKNGINNKLFKCLSSIYEVSQAELPVITSEKDGYNWITSRVISPT
ncbi:MAG: hypothetical protein U0M42_06930 [Acutalibacteraceae bacterium]|nr:hypothetical protein [Acutalibacteraceae bacterium]